MRFATEGVVKMLPLDQDAPNGCIRSICKKHKRLNKIVQKFELKVSKMTPAPLDYILALPKKVSRKLIERTREKLLFGKQDQLMSSLNATKKKWRKTKGLEMDDIDVARTLKELQQEML